METLNKSIEIIKSADKILIISGAGISKDSGIPTFRDSNGIWKQYSPLFWANKIGLYYNYVFRYKKFISFLIDVYTPIVNSKPNIAHISITEMQNHKEILVLTQNIDNLHTEAKNSNVYEIHGNVLEIKKDNKIIKKFDKDELRKFLLVLKNKKGKTQRKFLKRVLNFSEKIRPNVVLFNESINEIAYNRANDFILNADCILVIGTSLKIYPVSNFIKIAKRNFKPIINIGFENISNATNINKSCSVILPKIVNELQK